MMGYSRDSSGSFMYTVAYPMFVATLADEPEALALANDLDPKAGEYMRPALETVEKLIDSGCIDPAECDKIEDSYTQVIQVIQEKESQKKFMNGTKQYKRNNIMDYVLRKNLQDYGWSIEPPTSRRERKNELFLFNSE
jgi:hypothetical protein